MPVPMAVEIPRITVRVMTLGGTNRMNNAKNRKTMKINSFFMGASLCALLLSAVGCSNDNDLSDNGMVKITATAGIKNIGDTENPQRVSLGGDYGLVPLWEKDEQIAVKVDGGTVNTL